MATAQFNLPDALLAAIQDAVEQAAADELREAQERLAAKVRQNVGAIAAQVARSLDLETHADRLVITVRFEDGKRK